MTFEVLNFKRRPNKGLEVPDAEGRFSEETQRSSRFTDQISMRTNKIEKNRNPIYHLCVRNLVPGLLLFSFLLNTVCSEPESLEHLPDVHF